MKSRIKILLICALTCILLLASTFLLPFGFSAIHEDWTANFWLLISHSGGTVGVPLITIGFCILISLQYKGFAKKMLFLFISLIAFSVILGGFARLNEYFIKEKLKVERPNMIYLQNHYNFNLENFYSLKTKEERKRYLVWFISQQTQPIEINNEPIHPKVLQHWLHETGFSFPSGHSFNAYLMATLMAYILLFVYSDFRRRTFFILPLIWAGLVALSRVILGVHSPIDITSGAFLGSTAAIFIIRLGLIDRYLKQKPSNIN